MLEHCNICIACCVYGSLRKGISVALSRSLMFDFDDVGHSRCGGKVLRLARTLSHLIPCI